MPSYVVSSPGPINVRAIEGPVDPGWGMGRPPVDPGWGIPELPHVPIQPLPPTDPTPPGVIWPPLDPDTIWPPAGGPPVIGGGPVLPTLPPPGVGGGPVEPPTKAWVLGVIALNTGQVAYRWVSVDLTVSVTPPIAQTPQPRRG
jgi:hypothetical protein